MNEELRKVMEEIEALRRIDEGEEDQPEPVVRLEERTTCADDYPEDDIEWIWPGRVPAGQITAILGPRMAGKSFVAVDLIARVTSGAPWPDGPETDTETGRTPGSVLVVAIEDDHAKVVCRRLRAAQANLKKVRFLPYAYAKVKSARPFRAREVDEWEKIADLLPDLRMIVIDPFALLMGSSIDRRTNALPDILERLARFARERNVAVVLVNATDKVSAGKFWTHGVDALPLIRTAARAVWENAGDHGEPERRLFLPAQVMDDPNLGGLSFKIDPVSKRVVWDPEPIKLQVNGPPPTRREESNVARAARWLEEFMAHGDRTSEEVLREGAAAGHSRHALYQAKRRLKVPSRKLGGRLVGAWLWEMPVRAQESRFEDAKMTSRDVGGRGSERQGRGGQNSRAGFEDTKMTSGDVWARRDGGVARAPVQKPPEKPAHILEVEARMREAGLMNPVIWDGSDRPKRPGTFDGPLGRRNHEIHETRKIRED